MGFYLKVANRTLDVLEILRCKQPLDGRMDDVIQQLKGLDQYQNIEKEGRADLSLQQIMDQNEGLKRRYLGLCYPFFVFHAHFFPERHLAKNSVSCRHFYAFLRFLMLGLSSY